MVEVEQHNDWIGEIKKYLPHLTDNQVIVFALGYTLQSLRNHEDMNRFKWEI